MTAETIIAADTRINARWVIPIEPADQVWHHHAVIVQGGHIVAVLPQAEADTHYRTRETLSLPHHVLMPGLINLHGHAAMSLFRGVADDIPLMTWLNDHIWPLEGEFVCEQFVADGTQLAMAEMLRTGTTTFSDMYFFPEIAAQCAADAGMRAQICFPLLDFPTCWGSGPEEYLRKGEQLINAWQGDEFIMPAIGPHAPYTANDDTLAGAVALQKKTGVKLQIHLHETALEVQNAEQHSGQRPVSRMAQLGVLGPNTQCVHMTQVDDSDLEHLLHSGAHVVHCPESNMKLASGQCPVQRLSKAGVNVAIGTDGAASNNDLDLFGELRTAAMMAKHLAGDPAALSAHQALRMATLQGAKALGRGQDLGSLEAGKCADIIAVDLSDPFFQPVYNPASHLVYSLHSRAVSHSWINGVPQVQNGELTRIDVPDLMLRVADWAERIGRYQAG
ncbi:5-methylthioadenosine/S-adenosylhomocysteine deaminase [Marinobacter sp. LV10R520-4]|uniref:TRZ/ATZ family hydrolase n=1 Tax=Marinobacter sp. LV10R520-4 TaxID=1761796 RepID=UPI000BF7A111|nr:TRZ/ATZ family hydrolase [Marinobacter sp. LV10R520-4]PFG53887.1 5-methylthioadenosine/S-adenosylhomocysteine deaminase [Marinobacter sp. LV10R520-4]